MPMMRSQVLIKKYKNLNILKEKLFFLQIKNLLSSEKLCYDNKKCYSRGNL